jgi:hypothetical protein
MALDNKPTSDPYSMAPPFGNNTRSRAIAFAGLVFSLSCGFAFIAAGVAVFVRSKSITQNDEKFGDPAGENYLPLSLTSLQTSVLGLVLNGIVTMCTEATGYVHGTSLKWALARKGQLKFNANLRLVHAADGVNSRTVNILFGFLLVLSYATSSVIFLRSHIYDFNTSALINTITIVSYFPLIVLGIAISLQALLCLLALALTTIPTWSSHPRDITLALSFFGLVTRRPGRCMRAVADSSSPSSVEPIYPSVEPIYPSVEPIYPSSKRQLSPWSSHRHVRRVVWLVWALVPAGGLWGLITFLIVKTGQGGLDMNGNIIPNQLRILWNSTAPTFGLMWALLFIGGIQAVVTFGLHCCELVVNLSRDEGNWRAATSKGGMKPAGNPLWVAISSWQSLGLLISKPIIHWLFGRSMAIMGGDGVLIHPYEVYTIHSVFSFLLQLILTCCWQIWILSGGMIPVAVLTTFIANRHPPGPQPAAYGHIQTLTDLIDEWSPTMYWGHKGDDGTVCHAGELILSNEEKCPIHFFPSLRYK